MKNSSYLGDMIMMFKIIKQTQYGYFDITKNGKIKVFETTLDASVWRVRNLGSDSYKWTKIILHSTLKKSIKHNFSLKNWI